MPQMRLLHICCSSLPPTPKLITPLLFQPTPLSSSVYFHLPSGSATPHSLSASPPTSTSFLHYEHSSHVRTKDITVSSWLRWKPWLHIRWSFWRVGHSKNFCLSQLLFNFNFVVNRWSRFTFIFFPHFIHFFFILSTIRWSWGLGTQLIHSHLKQFLTLILLYFK